MQRQSFVRELRKKLSQSDPQTGSQTCEVIGCDNLNHKHKIDQITEKLINDISESAWSHLAATSGTTG